MVNKRSWQSVSFGLLFSLCCISVFVLFCFFIYAKENASPVFACVSFFGRLLFTSWIDLSWNQDVHFTRDVLSYYRSVLVCHLHARKNYQRSQQHFVSYCRLVPQQKNWISNLYKEESSRRSKLTKFIKRTLLFSLLCCYNSLLIHYYTHLVYYQLEIQLL